MLRVKRNPAAGAYLKCQSAISLISRPLLMQGYNTIEEFCQLCRKYRSAPNDVADDEIAALLPNEAVQRLPTKVVMFYNCETRLSTIASTMLQTCMQALLVPKSKLQQYIEPDNLLLPWRVLELNFWSCALQEIVEEATTYGGWSIEDSIEDVVGGSLLEHATATEMMAQVQAFGLIGLCVNGDKSEKLLSLYSSLLQQRAQTCSGQTTWHCRWIGAWLIWA